MIIVGAVVAVVVGIISRLFIRVPPGSVGLVVKSGRHDRVLTPGNRRVSPIVALSHLVTTREIAFDVPVSEVRSADGVGVAVDVLLTLRIADPVKFAYAITPGDADQFVQAACQDAVRTLVRGIEAMSALDLNSTQSDSLRQVIDPRLDAYGIDVSNVAFTRVTLPAALTDSLEARRLASLQLAEQAETSLLDKRRLADQAALVSQEAESRRSAVEYEAAAEALRLAMLEERIGANPNAARYDLELSRIRVAEQLAGNSRAVVSLGATDLMSSLLTAREAVVANAAADAADAGGSRRDGRRRSQAGLSDPMTDGPEPGDSGAIPVPGDVPDREMPGPIPVPGGAPDAGHVGRKPAPRAIRGPPASVRRRSGRWSRSPPSSSSWSARSRCARSRPSSCPWCSACSSRSSPGPWSASWSGAVPATPSPSPPP